jgi:uncharacterized protein (DUF983 family)
MRWNAILRLRCPRCGQGHVYQPRSLLRMYHECIVCGLKYEREPGFFLGAMYFSYGLAILAALPLCVWLFFREVPAHWNALASAGVIVLLSPLLIRYSRVLWLHFDHRWDPR